MRCTSFSLSSPRKNEKNYKIRRILRMPSGYLLLLVSTLVASLVVDGTTVTEEAVGSRRRRNLNAFDHITVPAASTGKGRGSVDLTYATEMRSFNGHNLTAHFAWFDNPRDTFHVRCPHCSGPDGRCGGIATVPAQAKQHNCTYATNGGPFNMKTGGCIGNIVTDGRIVFNATSPSSSTCVGLGEDGSWRMGSFSSDEVQQLNFTQFLCGFDWLVHNRTNAVPAAGGLIAPRTGLGIDEAGRLLLFEVDGAQFFKMGLTMQQTAAWMQDLGAVWAMDLDGGGSSTAYYAEDGGVQGCPTCIDIPVCCDRSVTTIVCMK